MFRYSLHFYFVVPAVKSCLTLIFKLNVQKFSVPCFLLSQGAVSLAVSGPQDLYLSLALSVL